VGGITVVDLTNAVIKVARDGETFSVELKELTEAQYDAVLAALNLQWPILDVRNMPKPEEHWPDPCYCDSGETCDCGRLERDEDSGWSRKL
jgi:hypothetical protein